MEIAKTGHPIKGMSFDGYCYQIPALSEESVCGRCVIEIGDDLPEGLNFARNDQAGTFLFDHFIDGGAFRFSFLITEPIILDGKEEGIVYGIKVGEGSSCARSREIISEKIQWMLGARKEFLASPCKTFKEFRESPGGLEWR